MKKFAAFLVPLIAVGLIASTPVFAKTHKASKAPVMSEEKKDDMAAAKKETKKKAPKKKKMKKPAEKTM